MKYNLFIFFSLLFGFNLSAQTTYPTGASGCVGRWDFTTVNGTFASLPDVSGNNNNGSAINLTGAAGWRNMPNTAALFNGSSSESIVPHHATLTPSAFTIVALVKFNGFYSGTCNASQILSKGYPYFIAGNYGLAVGDNYFDNSCQIFSPNNMQMDVQAQNQGNFPVAGNYVNTNDWYFMAATFDVNETKYYQEVMDATNKLSSINPYQTIVATMGVGMNTQDLSIGSHLNPLYRYWFNGRMDELVLFNRVLSPEELYIIYDYLFATPAAPNSISHQEMDNLFEMNNFNNKVIINTNIEKYNVRISTITGATVYLKEDCSLSQNIDLSHLLNQILIVEILSGSNRLIKKL